MSLWDTSIFEIDKFPRSSCHYNNRIRIFDSPFVSPRRFKIEVTLALKRSKFVFVMSYLPARKEVICIP